MVPPLKSFLPNIRNIRFYARSKPRGTQRGNIIPLKRLDKL
jgi:hypothetical protein